MGDSGYQNDIDMRRPRDSVAGYSVCPGYYELNGAQALGYGGAVSFTVHSHGAREVELLLFARGEKEPYAVIPYPEDYRIGDVWAMVVFDLDITKFEYAYRVDGPWDPGKGLLFDKRHVLLDIYAKAVTGQRVWGERQSEEGVYHARVVRQASDWGDHKKLRTPMEDLIIYELHVRGFTMGANAGVSAPGTFAGVREKIPYLKWLGVTAVELMPIFEFDEMQDLRNYEGKRLMDYWGYNTVSYFAPNTSYTSKTEYNEEGGELRDLIRDLHEAGIQVILDVVFNHTAEGNADGHFINFKGFDNNIYYMLTPEGDYYNFSGCGNTVNCNHPVVQEMIVECLHYWAVNFHIDGFRFDLASILGRNEDGSPMEYPPLLQRLAMDPLLADVRLIAEAWDAGGLYQVGSFPSWHRWAEWNGRYRDDLRRFLKGDSGMAWNAVQRIAGSRDMYDPSVRGDNSTVNFLTCHDGFTLWDVYSYNHKHNEANGWSNLDGMDDNNSWNCGAEGETDDPAVNNLRIRMVKNAFTSLLCSRGAVMFYAGDEFCNTQFGNNNAYCQDNGISWLDWSRLEQFQEVHDYVQDLIAFRKAHPVVRRETAACSLGFPSMSIHNSIAWNDSFQEDSRCIGIMFAGRDDAGEDDAVFIGINAYWETVPMQLPELPVGWYWSAAFYTDMPYHSGADCNILLNREGDIVQLPGRSAVVMEMRNTMRNIGAPRW